MLSHHLKTNITKKSSPTSQNKEVITEVTDTYLKGKENILKYMKLTMQMLIFYTVHCVTKKVVWHKLALMEYH